MRTRLLTACGFALAVTWLMSASCSESSQPDVQAQSRAVPADRGSVDLAGRIDTLFKNFCERSCEQNYQSCIIYQGQMLINARLDGVAGVGKTRAPLKQELPGCWPFACEDENPDPAKPKPAPSCSAARDACLAKCR